MTGNRRYDRQPYQRRNSKRGRAVSSILLTLLIFFTLVAIIVHLPANHQAEESLSGSIYVIDGDTVVLNKVRIRLLGIDAPEMEQSCQIAERDYLCGRDARNALRSKTSGKAIRCQKHGIDKYGRTLGRCYLGEADLNQWMVEQGWAVSYDDYRTEESEARRHRRGIWVGNFDLPYQWRKEHQKPNTEAETGRNAPELNETHDLINYIRKIVLRLLNI